MDKDLGVAVVGYGYWSPKLIRNLDTVPGLVLRAICEKDESRHAMIAAAHPGVHVYRHYRDAFDDASIDAVIIATIPSSHYRIAKLALEKNLHVLVEKPLTLSTGQGEVLVDLARQRNRTLMIDHTYLYSPAIGKLGEIIRSGELGKIYSIDSIRTNLGLFQRDTNVVWDLAPHDFSILLLLTDERPTHVTAIGTKTVVHPKQVRSQESDAHIMLSYASGLSVHVHVSWISPVKTRTITVVGSERMAMYDQLADEQLAVFDQGVYANESEGESGPLFTYKTGETTNPEYEKEGEDLSRMLGDFAISMKTGSTPRASAALGLETVRLLCAVQESLEHEGRKVRVRYARTSYLSRLLMRVRPK